MPGDIAKEIDALQHMTTGELADRYEQLHGQPVRTRHRTYLIRKIAWRIQTNAEGDLSERARRRAAELADDAEVRLMAPKTMICPPQSADSTTVTRPLPNGEHNDARYRSTLQLPPADELYIAGAGHVGQALARLAIPLEFSVTMFDDRQDLLERFAPPEAARVSGSIATELNAAPIDGQTYCVIVTRGHRHDEQALAAVLNRGARCAVRRHDRQPPQGEADSRRPAGDAEIIESIKAGLLRALTCETMSCVLLHPADHPDVHANTVRTLLRTHRDQPDRAVMPEHRGRGGHPVLIPRPLIADLLAFTGSGGLRAYWDLHPERRLRVAVDDPQSVTDFDTAETYAAQRARR